MTRTVSHLHVLPSTKASDFNWIEHVDSRFSLGVCSFDQSYETNACMVFLYILIRSFRT